MLTVVLCYSYRAFFGIFWGVHYYVFYSVSDSLDLLSKNCEHKEGTKTQTETMVSSGQWNDNFLIILTEVLSC